MLLQSVEYRSRDGCETSSRSFGERSSHRKKSDHRSSRDRSREFRDRHCMRGHQSPGKSNREYRRHRSRSEERDDRRFRKTAYEHERYDERRRRYEDDRLGSRGIELPPHYLEPVPVPFYYGNYARPIMVDPMVAMRGPLGIGRGRMPPMMGGPRPPYPPRFIPPMMFRAQGPSNPRF
ncbi:hypothetical protein PV326_011414 [Microctonus aethiopoides]|nr:hypothetical protein PV326_011414 [Microctonus aethiopoides]